MVPRLWYLACQVACDGPNRSGPPSTSSNSASSGQSRPQTVPTHQPFLLLVTGISHRTHSALTSFVNAAGLSFDDKKEASLAESVGEFGLGKCAECVK